MYGHGRIRAQSVTRIKLRPGLTMVLGEGSVYDSTQDLSVTLTKAKSVWDQNSLCDRSGSRVGGVI